MPAIELPLAGERVLVTRPAGQGEALAARLAALGATAWICPLLELVPLALGPAELEVLRRPGAALVFVSAAAVQHYLRALASAGLPVPADLPAFAVGEATAEALRDAGFRGVHQPPAGAETSEGLLALPALQALLAQRLCLVRGRGGREALAGAVAAARGELALLELYARRLPERDWAAAVAEWQNTGLTSVLVTSGESLDNLERAAGPAQAWLHGRALVVAGARLAARAAELGWDRVAVAAGAGDEAMLAALIACGRNETRQ